MHCERPRTPLTKVEIIRHAASNMVLKGAGMEKEAGLPKPSPEEIAERVKEAKRTISELIDVGHVRIEGNNVMCGSTQLI